MTFQAWEQNEHSNVEVTEQVVFTLSGAHTPLISGPNISPSPSEKKKVKLYLTVSPVKKEEPVGDMSSFFLVMCSVRDIKK